MSHLKSRIGVEPKSWPLNKLHKIQADFKYLGKGSLNPDALEVHSDECNGRGISAHIYYSFVPNKTSTATMVKARDSFGI